MLPLLFSLVLAGASPAPERCPAELPLLDALALAEERSAEARGLERAVRERQTLDEQIPLFVGNPQVLLQTGPRALPTSDFGIEGAIGLSLPLDVSGRGFAERQSAAASRATLLAERDQALLDARLLAADAWIRLWQAQRALALTRSEVEVAEDVVRAMTKAAEREAVSSADAARARRYLAGVKLELAEREGEVFHHSLALATALGCSELSASLGELPVPAEGDAPDGQAAAAAAAAHPAVRARLHAAKAAREQGSALARGAWDGVSVGLIGEKDGPDNYRALLELQLPLPVFERGQRERAAAVAEASRLEGEREALERAARAELTRALHEVEHTRAVLEVARETLVPASDDAERLEELAFTLGASTLIERLRAREERLEAARALLDAEARHTRARWHLSLLTEALASASAGAAP